MATNFPTGLDGLRAAQGLTDGTSVVTVAPHNNMMDAIDALEAKVGVTDSAVTSSLDYKVSHKGAFASGVTVFNAYVAAANTWQDLDLSAQVGANVAMVYLEATGASALTLAVKPKGFGSATFSNHYSASIIGASAATLNGKYVYLVCFTDSAGVIQIGANYGGSATYNMTIKLIGYSK